MHNYMEYSTFDEHFERCYNYMSKRINNFGHFNLWTNSSLLMKKEINLKKIFLIKNILEKFMKMNIKG